MDKKLQIIFCSVLGLLLFTALVLTIVLTAYGCSFRRGENGPDPGPSGETKQSETESQTQQPSSVLQETPDAGLSYQDEIIFVGDSTTAHLRSREVLTGGKDTKQVWCPDNNTLLLDSEITSVKIVYPELSGEDAYKTIPEAASLKQPKYMIITLGLNGIMSHVDNRKNFEYSYSKLIDAIKSVSSETKIIIQSIFPVSAACNAFSADAAQVNQNIDTVNGWLRELSAQKGVYYLDSQSVLKDGSGMLKTEYDNGDGIHLTKSAYELLLSYIRTHAVPNP